jgi:hypothetical protein
VFLTAVVLVARPIPSKVITIIVNPEDRVKGSVVVSESVPSDSQLFEDEEDVLVSITTGNH